MKFEGELIIEHFEDGKVIEKSVLAYPISDVGTNIVLDTIPGTCKTCRWFNNNEEELYRVCNCPKMVYGYGKEEAAMDGVNIENDEGWGMIPGPDFGCIHHKEKS